MEGTETNEGFYKGVGGGGFSNRSLKPIPIRGGGLGPSQKIFENLEVEWWILRKYLKIIN